VTVGETRYSRQIMLPEIGAAGQARLSAARVLMVGAGGLGCPVLQYLAAAGVGHLTIVDPDTVARHNLHRQILFEEADVDRLKVEVAAEKLRGLNTGIEVMASSERFSTANARHLIEQSDLVIDGSDNFPTRYLVNDACVVVGRPLVSGSVFRFSGQVTVFNYPVGVGPTYRCLFPEPPPPEEVPGCGESGVVGVLPGLVGLVQATEVVKLLTGAGEVLAGRMLLIDALRATWRTVSFQRNDSIVQSTRILSEGAYAALGTCSRGREKMREITPTELKRRLDEGEQIHLIDVREPCEREIASIGGELIPLKELSASLDRVPREGTVVIYCRSGGRSGQAVLALERAGYTNLINLAGGVLRWADEVDPGMQKY